MRASPRPAPARHGLRRRARPRLCARGDGGARGHARRRLARSVSAPRNLVNLAAVGKGFAARTVLRDVTLGVAAGDRIGVVGRNGAGKSTLLRLIAALEEPDSGAVTRSGGVGVALLGQGDDLDP